AGRGGAVPDARGPRSSGAATVPRERPQQGPQPGCDAVRAWRRSRFCLGTRRGTWRPCRPTRLCSSFRRSGCPSWRPTAGTSCQPTAPRRRRTRGGSFAS
ncbi:unnamed protein product, partial [Prorocentrum cordatum]